MSAQKCYFNGKIIAPEDAGIGIADSGFLHGASAFTTMRAHNGVVFRLDKHLSRLMETVAYLQLRTDATGESLTAGVGDLLEANELGEARVRITLTPGPVGGETPTTLITAEPLGDYPPQWYEKGVTVIVSSFKQIVGDPLAGYKTGCYFPRILARAEAAAKGADEALWFTSDNRLAEACFCNVFLVLGGKVHTPSLDTPILPGIVRQAVIELCEKLGIDCDDQTPLTVRQMLAAEEIFLTASTMGVRPVASVERHAVGEEKPGEITKKLTAAYEQLLDAECKPPGER